MPGKVKVKIISGRNLPVMDRSSDTTDAYVEIKLGTTTFKTDVCRKSLHPQWNSEWYRFELDDAELQDEPLQIRLMDHDTYSANDAIGKVYLDLNPLLLPVTSLLGKWNDGGNSCHEGNSSVMSGWIPVYDTMHGIRGEVNVVVKVELFTDFNKFRQSSCGVQFFCSPAIPHGFYAQVIHGFVEELVVNDDPEYQWIDKIRTPRASNEARQTLFCKLSGELQRRIGLKALEMGGNAVIGYNQCFDLEGESGIVARGIGTAVSLVKIMDLPSPSPNNENINDERAQSYLKFLGSAKGFYLNNNSNIITDKLKSQLYSIPSPTASFRSLKAEKRILKPEIMPPFLTRHLSDREFNYPLPIGPESMMQHSVSLQTLLKQEDQRGRTGSGISQRFRNLKYTSQNMITRKMTALKAKLGNDDNESEGKRILMRYRRTQSDNTGMAEILVRSVFHATTSLDCIAESPKPSSDEEIRDRSFLSLPSPIARSSPASSCNSCNESSSSADDDDEDDDEDEEEEEATGDVIGELDTVSHIVETVRKLSMIQTPIENELEYDENKFLFVIGDADDQPDVSFDGDLDDDANLLYYQEADDEKSSEVFLPQFAKSFEKMRKSTTANSLSGVDIHPDEDQKPLNKKFTSLHNFYASESRWNKYSAHGGKETVLGELFRWIDSAHPLSETDSEFDSRMSVADTGQEASSVKTSQDFPKDNVTTDLSKEDENSAGLKRTKPLKLFVAPHGEDTIESGINKTKETTKGFLPKKVLQVLHKLDSKLHHKSKKSKKKELKSEKTTESHFEAHPQVPHLPGHSHVLDLEESDKHGLVDSPSMSLSHISQQSSGSDEHKHGLLHKLKEGKDKLLHAPAELLHRLDSKIHDHGAIKHEHGLLNIALGNVLMDTMQEVLVTSHTASPNDKPPEFPHFETPLEAEEVKKEVSGDQNKKLEETLSEHSVGTNGHKHSLLDKLKEGKDKLIHSIDTKIHHHHHHHEGEIKNEHGLLNIALGNVLMDSMQEVLVTSHTASPNDKPPEFPHFETPLESEEVKKEVSVDQNKKLEDTLSEHSVGTDSHKHSLLEKLKEGRDRLLHGPKELIHSIDTKIHHHHEGGIKNEHGLLNIALGNVLMDSVQDVLATSHTASPNDKPPEFPQPQFDLDKSVEEPPQTHVPHMPNHSHVLELDDLKKEPSIEHHEHQEETLPEYSTANDDHKHGLLDRLKEGRDKLFHLGQHHQNAGGIKNEHGLLNIALGNVLMDSVQDVLATSTPSPTAGTPEFPVSTPELPHSHILEINQTEESTKPDETADRRHSILDKIKESKDKLLLKIDNKLHHPDPGIKNEHGLLNIALGNVLMDSVQEVLATSSSPTTESPKFTPTPKSPDLPTTSSNLLSEQTDKQLSTNSLASRPLNTQIDGGDHDCINTTHACLTTPRHVETTPVPLNPTPTAASDSRNGENGHQRTESLGVRIAHSPAKLNAIPCIHRRSSDSDLSITPKGNSLTGSDRSGGYSSGQYMRGAMLRTTRPQENFDIMEYPFLTLSKYPPGFIAHIGGSVSARSVKLLERITNLEEPESRDTWWSEIRMEIRSHARALNCNAVLGYTESTSICDDVCVLSASGTAAVLGFQHTSTTGESADNVGGLPILPKNNTNSMTTSLDRNDFEKDKDKDRENKEKPKVEHPTMCTTKPKTVPTVNGANTSPERESTQHLKPACSITHLPYVSNSKPLRSSSIKCCTCGAYKVPDMLIATIEIPEGMPNFGRGCFIQSYVCRPLKDLKGESNAKEISDGLPFLEYELHRFLINKLKVKGMNAIFGLKVRISIGERMLIGIATGTAVFLSSLPPPLLPKLVSDRTTDEKKLTQLQKDLHDTIKRNREIYQLRSIEEVNGESNKLLSESDGSEDETPGLDLAVGNKDCCILEVDDPDDADVLKSVLEPRPPDGFHVVNTEHVPGLEDLEIVKNLQMFTQIWRAKIPPPFDLDKHFHRLLQSVYFKLRRMIPCALCDLQFRVDSPEPDEIQLCVVGMALGLGDPLRNAKKRKTVITKRVDDDLIFNLEEDQIPEHSVAQTPPTTHLLQTQSLKHRQKSPIRNKLLTKQRHVPYRERHGVDITPLSYVPGGKIEKYLGNLNFFFIRETTSLREEGGLSGFVHSFVTEILAIVRAHVTALGGNAMVAYFITECVLNHNLHKNQGQCLINVGGDVVYVSYFTEDH
ncbi:uncharacterized protein [Atheta coriaria]|uniref:uncharacterized protein isoform X2 n=1 Tax=Dalotia coriaria TaxID=877792 RepID=UPI0031F44930